MMPSDATAITTDDLLRIIGEQHVQIITLQRMLAQREAANATTQRAIPNDENAERKNGTARVQQEQREGAGGEGDYGPPFRQAGS